MSNALSNPAKTQTIFTRADLNVSARNLLFRMKAELFDFDARPPIYKPRWKLEKVGEALLLHREIERLNAQRYGHEQAVINDDDDDNDGNVVVVDGGDA